MQEAPAPFDEVGRAKGVCLGDGRSADRKQEARVLRQQDDGKRAGRSDQDQDRNDEARCRKDAELTGGTGDADGARTIDTALTVDVGSREKAGGRDG